MKLGIKIGLKDDIDDKEKRNVSTMGKGMEG